MKSNIGKYNLFNSSIQASQFAQIGRVVFLTGLSLVNADRLRRLGKPAVFLLLGLMLLPLAAVGTLTAQETSSPARGPIPEVERRADASGITERRIVTMPNGEKYFEPYKRIEKPSFSKPETNFSSVIKSAGSFNAESLIEGGCEPYEIDGDDDGPIQTYFHQIDTSSCFVGQTDITYYNEYTFFGTAGEQININAFTLEFNMGLSLRGPNGYFAGSNSVLGPERREITSTLPFTGNYTIRVEEFGQDYWFQNFVGGDYYLSFARGTSACTYVTWSNSTDGSYTIGHGWSHFGGTNRSQPITAPSGCEWFVTDDSAWLTTDDSFHEGSEDFSYDASPNNTGAPRRGSVTAAGLTIFVYQDSSTPCSTTPINYGTTINGNFSTSDCTNFGSYQDLYTFNGTTGNRIAISTTRAAGYVSIWLVRPNGNSVFPDEEGFYTLDETGTYTIRAWSSGEFDLPNATGPYTLKITNNTSISGRVTTSNGEGVGGITMTLTSQVLETPVVVTTQPGGDYTFPNVQTNGEYKVTPTHDDYTLDPNFRDVTVASSPVTSVNFTAYPNTRTISGRVVTNTGVGLGGVTVTLTRFFNPLTAAKESSNVGGIPVVPPVMTDENGNYTFIVNNFNPFDLYHVTPSRQYYTFDPPNRLIDGGEGPFTGVNFTAYPVIRKISGRVSTSDGVGLADVTITLTPDNGVRSGNAEGGSNVTRLTDGNGNYEFDNVTPGFYRVTPTKTNYTFELPSRFVDVFETNRSDINFTAYPVYHSISGRVIDNNGAGLNGVVVNVSGDNKVNRNETTSDGGFYTFTNLPRGGSYTVKPNHQDYNFDPPQLPFNNLNENKEGVNFTGTLKTYSIRGRVTDELTGNGVSGVNISVDGISTTVPVVTQADGTYTFPNVTRGNYVVRPSLQGRTFNPESQPVQVTNGDVDNVNFIRLSFRYKISGKVTNSLGDPVTGVSIRRNGEVAATTGSDGGYVIENVLPGNHAISPFLSGGTFTPDATPVQVTDGDANNINFTLNCVYQLSQQSTEVSAAGTQTGNFAVSSLCRWSASVSSPTPWITVNGSSSGNGSVSFTVSPNETTETRTGSISVGDKIFNISQSPSQANCLFSLSQTSANVPAKPNTSDIFSFEVRTTTGCAWTATSEVDWIMISPQTRTGTGTGNVNFTVSESITSRIGRIRVQGRVFTVYQSNSESVPANDNFENPVILASASNVPQEVIANNTRATEQPNEPDHAGQPGNHSVWYKWTAIENGDYNFTTSGSIPNQGNQQVSLIDTLLAVYEEGSLSTALPISAANDDVTVFDRGSNLTFRAEAGKTYLIAVDSKGNSDSNTGMIKLRWRKVTRVYRFYGLTGNGEISTQEPTLRVFKVGGGEVPNVVEKVAPGTFDVYLPSDNDTYEVRFAGENENSAVKWSPSTHPIQNSTVIDSVSSEMKKVAGESVMNPQENNTNVSRAINSNFNVIGYISELKKDEGNDLEMVREVQEGPFPANKENCPKPEFRDSLGVFQYVCGTLLDTSHVFTPYKRGKGFLPERIRLPKLQRTVFPEDAEIDPNFKAFTQQTGNLGGTVRKGGLTGPTMGGVRVTLRRSDGWEHSENSTESGNFTFAGLRADTYTLTGEFDGYTFDPITGVVILDGQTTTTPLIGTVRGDCNYRASRNQFSDIGVEGGSRSFTITTTPAGCEWSPTVDSSSSWLKITSHSSDSIIRGANTVTFSIEPNSAVLNRPGTIKIISQNKVEVTVNVIQQGLASCNYRLNQRDNYIPPDASAGSYSVEFSTSQQVCRNNLQALLSDDAEWITDVSAQGGQVVYKVQPNNGENSKARVGRITVGNAELIVIQAPKTSNLPVGFDFTKDKKADISVYRSSNGYWYVLNSATNEFIPTQWGIATDKILPGDYDGDDKLDYAVWRSPCNFANETNKPCLFILRSKDNTIRVQIWQESDGIPMSGDWDNDKKADIAVYRPNGSIWNIWYSDGGADPKLKFGEPGDEPIAGDFNGDGRRDFAVFSPTTGHWSIKYFSDSEAIIFKWGQLGDIPTPADFDGDGKDDIAVYRPSNGTWYILRSAWDPEDTKTQLGFTAVRFGVAEDTPVASDMDGDGRADVAVYRRSVGTWYILRSGDNNSFYGVQFGLPFEDKPVPGAFNRMP